MSFVHVGKILSAQGIRGDLFVYIFSGEAAWSERWKELHLGAADVQQPQRSYKIKKIKPHQKQRKQGFVVTLEEVTDRNQAEEIVGQGVFIPEDFLVSDEGEDIYLREVLGFHVQDQSRGFVGSVVGFAGNSFQDIVVIKTEQGESFEVPFVEPLLVEIDKEAKKISMDIPQGLVPGEEL